MIRLFDTHYIREVQELDGMWRVTMENAEGQALPGEYTMPVPGCFEQHPQFLDFRGHAVYHRKVMIKNDGNVRLEGGQPHGRCILGRRKGGASLQCVHPVFGRDSEGKGRNA